VSVILKRSRIPRVIRSCLALDRRQKRYWGANSETSSAAQTRNAMENVNKWACGRPPASEMAQQAAEAAQDDAGLMDLDPGAPCGIHLQSLDIFEQEDILSSCPNTRNTHGPGAAHGSVL